MDRLSLALQAARAAPSADNSQPWQVRWDGASLSVHYRPHAGIDPFGPGGHATLIGVGAVAENLCQAVGPNAGELMPGNLVTGSPYFSLPLPEHDMPATEAGLPLFNRHTNRFPYSQRTLSPASLDELAAMAESPARLALVTTATARQAFSNVAKVCCQARFCNQELHEWLMGSLRFSEGDAARGDGLDVATLHLPPGGASFMQAIRPWQRMAALNKLGIFRLMALTEIQPLRHASLILCVVGADTSAGAFAAGRLMERAWIHLNQLGLAVHPYYVVADQQTRLTHGHLPDAWRDPVSQALADLPPLLNLGTNERLHIALRVGWPTKQVRRSRRLPLDLIFRDESRLATAR